MTCPVTCPAAGEARNATVAATSAVVPARPVRVSATDYSGLRGHEEALLSGLTAAY
jgi:hypothetical protein